MITDVTSNDDFKKYTDAPEYCLVAFHDPTNGPSRMMNPKLEQFSREFPSIRFFRIDVNDLCDVANLYGISAIPTYQIVAWGQVFHQLVGGSKDKLEALLKLYDGNPPPPNPRRGNLIDSLFT